MREQVENLIGRRFGRLVVIGKASRARDGRVRWQCICDCNNKYIARAQTLKREATKSCGCLNKEEAAKRKRTHGASGTRAYYAFQNMWNRCTRKQDKSYENYGGRGIYVSPKWEKFSVFLRDMGQPSPGETLERIDNNGPYSPGNCIWASRGRQGNNKRNNIFITYKGKTLTLAQWSRRAGINYTTVLSRYSRGMSASKILAGGAYENI